MSTQDPYFNGWKELYQWVADSNPLRYDGKVYRSFHNGRYDLSLDGYIGKYQKVIEKEKITLYRYTYENTVTGTVLQSSWINSTDTSTNIHKIIKTETKIIEVD